jgi:hypothetical protein
MLGQNGPAARVKTCGILASGVLLAAAADSVTVTAAESAASKIPDFGISSEMAWHEIGDEYLPPRRTKAGHQ